MVCSLPHTPSCSEKGRDDKDDRIHDAYLAGDGVEDIAVVKVPALVAQLVRTSFHQADHIVPENYQLRAKLKKKDT